MIKPKSVDLTFFKKALSVQQSIMAHALERKRDKSSQLYYHCITNYFERILTDISEGKPIVCHSTATPVEIFEAMGITPLSWPFIMMIFLTSANTYDSGLSAATEMGIVAQETCPGHKSVVGHFYRGWWPRPTVIVWGSDGECDPLTKSPEAAVKIYDVPGFYIDRPRNYTENAVQFVTHQLADLVHFLEQHTHRKMDWDKLKEAVKNSKRIMEMQREIYRLKKLVPCPMRPRSSTQQYLLHFMLAGTDQGVRFFETLCDELRGRAERKEGVVKEERYRLISSFIPPGAVKVLDWVERECGGVFVLEPIFFNFRKGDLDPSNPLESLARKYYLDPLIRVMSTPLEIIDEVARDAIEAKAQGAVFWSYSGSCRAHAPFFGVFKHAMKTKVGIPTVSMECRQNCLPLAQTEELKERFVQFFEMLESYK